MEYFLASQSPCMDEESLAQQEGRDSEGDTAAATNAYEVFVKNKIKEILEEMEPLPGRISNLLRKHRARRRLIMLRYYKFLQVELSDIVASLNQIYSLSEPLGPDYADEYFYRWLIMCSRLASITDRLLLPSEQFASCFCRTPRLSLYGTGRHVVLLILFQVTESPFMYKHILGDGDDGDRTSRTSCSAAQLHPYAVEEGGDVFLVGIEETLRNKRLRWFMADEREAENKTPRVMSMVGPAGVGKTALAMEVYRQLQQIQGEGHRFQCCITVKVSDRPDMIELLKHILSQIVDESEALTPDSSIQPSQITTLQHKQELLAREVSQCLQDKRYLIVIDDMRDESDWYIIKNAFPHNRLGNRIIVTTQLRSVGQLCSSHFTDGLVHEVKPLSQLDSERLFFRKKFGSKDSCLPENLRQVCDKILRRCEGIPLFIIGMADLWREQQEELQHISTSYSTEIISKLPKQIQQALSNTYYDLTGLSKALLMYMSMFCEGHLFEKDSLIFKWMLVHGMIETDLNLDEDSYDSYGYKFFENAKRCLSELIDRNIITSVRGHIHQVEGDYLQVNYFTSSTLTSVVEQGGKKQGRRLFLRQPADPQLPNLLTRMDLSHIRSLAISGDVDGIPLERFTYLVVLDLEGWQCLKDEDMLRICKMFLLHYLSLRKTTGVSKLPPEIKELPLLYTLDISHTSICELPSQVCELQLLHTLDISHTSICEIPSQVCELQWLETLDLRSTPVRKLPERIGNLDNLHCLLINGEGVKCEETITVIPRFQHLNTLATVDLSGCSPSLVEALGEFRRLLVLAITWSFHQCSDRRFQNALRACIGKWELLRSLTIHCGLGCCMDFLDSLPDDGPSLLEKFKVPGGRFGRIPQWFAGLSSLTFIEITICRLDPKEDLSILGNLPVLECLMLGLHFIPEATIVIDEIGFYQLKRLSVDCRVPWLTFNEGAMQKLTFLQLKIAGSLASQESVPSGIYNLKSLSEVAIRYHANYTNSPSVRMTIEAVRKEVYNHRMPINLFINDIEDEEEDVEAAREKLKIDTAQLP